MAALASKTAAQARIRTLSACEALNHPNPRYLAPSTTHSISERHREKVVKWINELAEDFGFYVQTGGIACNYFDRYTDNLLKESPSSIGNMRALLTVATTCLLMAAKFFDRKLPPLSELSRLHHGNTSPEEFAALELRILASLKWQLHVPMPHSFVEPILCLCKDEAYDTVVADRMYFFIDLSVYGYHFLEYSPAQITAASLLTAWKFSNEHDAVPRNIKMLAAAVDCKPLTLSTCANQLVEYYKLCFPEAAKTFEQINLFLPINAQGEKSTAKNEPGTEGRSISPDSVLPMHLG
jgi:hypothetical protein